jgi:hypothetical protein
MLSTTTIFNPVSLAFSASAVSAESGIDCVGRLLLHMGRDMAVQVKRNPNLRVAEHL